MTGLRPYQLEAVSAAIRDLRSQRSTLIVMPTGTGKTQVFCGVASKAAGRVLILAHRDELISQAASRVEQVVGLMPAIEQADHHADLASKIVVGSVQTLQGQRLARWPRDQFSLLIYDEAHHSVAPSGQAIIEHFKSAKLLGVTATPDRQDKEALGQIYESVAYAYELPDAVADGWLVRPLLRRVILEAVDLAKITVRAGDLAPGELEGELGAPDVLAAISRSMLEYGSGRRILAYTPGVRMAHELAAELRRQSGCDDAAAIDGTMDMDLRRSILERHASGELKILVNCQILTEGYDSPGVDCIAVIRPTRSRALYAQMIGRGLRLAPQKQDCLILDYAGATSRLDLVGPEDVLGAGDDVAAEARRQVGDGGKAVDVLEQLELAAREIRYRLEAVDLERRRRAKNAVLPADLWRWLGLRERDWVAQAEYGGQPATARQLAALGRFGVAVDDGLPRGAAGRLLDLVISRARARLASPRQLRILVGRGIGDGTTTAAEASASIDALAARGWR